MAGEGETVWYLAIISRVKKSIFSCRDVPPRNIVNFFLAMARNLHILVRNWYNLARNYTFWRELVVFGETRPALVRKILTLFLAGICTAKDIEKPPGLSTP